VTEPHRLAVERPIVVALDFPRQEQAEALLAQLDPGQCRVKVGKELFTRAGPRWVRSLVERGHSVFLDLKFHDIPNTVAAAVSAAAELGVWMINVHALGGPAMLKAAREALEPWGREAPLLTAVTVLTSMDAEQLKAVGVADSPAEQVLRLARLSREAGLDGVVCSAQEAPLLRDVLGADFTLVTPGIRPAGARADDQHRTATPVEALRQGSHYLVIGRPITRSDHPQGSLEAIQQDIFHSFGRA